MASVGGVPKSPEQVMVEAFFESCPFKCVFSGIAGFGLGGMFGIFVSSIGPGPNEDPTKLKLKEVLRTMRQQSFSYAKNFGMVGALYAGSECAIESIRAKHDIYNSLSAGCFTGAVLAGRAGPQAMALGCVGFAAFSVAIETYMEGGFSSNEDD